LQSGENLLNKNLKISKMRITVKKIGMFFNTIKESGQELEASKEKTLKQDQIILNAFKPNGMNSAWLMYNANVLPHGTPITSYRRSLHTLLEQGKIERVGQRIGNLDKKEFTYKLNLES
jgi:hypothetical protein